MVEQGVGVRMSKKEIFPMKAMPKESDNFKEE